MRQVIVILMALMALLVSACTGMTTTNETINPGQEQLAKPTAIATLAEVVDVAEEATQAPAEASESAIATPTPLDNALEAGESRAIALATDIAMSPDIAEEDRLTFADSPVQITFSEFYDGFDIRRGLQISDKLKSLDGQQVIIEGYMAPPLKPALDWFVVTRVPLALCPFCSTDSDWPNDISLAYMPEGVTVLANDAPLRITGQLEVGVSTDAETGMVSMVRIYVEEMEEIR